MHALEHNIASNVCRDERLSLGRARVRALPTARRAVNDGVQLVRRDASLDDSLDRRPRLPEHEPAEQHGEKHHDHRATGDARRASRAQTRAREGAGAIAATAVGVGQHRRGGEDGVIERARAGEQRVAGVGVTRLGVEAQRCALIGVGAPRFVEWIDQTRRGWVVLHRFIRGGGDEVGAEPQTEQRT